MARTIKAMIGMAMGVAIVLAGVAGATGEAEARYRLERSNPIYRITPSVVDGWTLDADANTDAAEKAAAKALRFTELVGMGSCALQLIDQNNDGTETTVGSGNCEVSHWLGPARIRYDGGSRSWHPGTTDPGPGGSWIQFGGDITEHGGLNANAGDMRGTCTAARALNTNMGWQPGDSTASNDLFCNEVDGSVAFVNAAARAAYHSR